MAVVNPLHLLEQASELSKGKNASRPRQVDLRRSISSAYYAVFHLVLTAAADEFVGRNKRGDRRHSLVDRSIDHRNLRKFCEEVSRPLVSARFRTYLPADGFDRELRDFANILVRLQSLRHEADYDPTQNFSAVDATFAVYLAQSAIEEFSAASLDAKRLFLTLLLFPPR